MAITFGQARLLLAQYAGRGGLCPEDPQVDLFILEVLQTILFKGPSKSIRTFCFQAQRGCITIPYELEAPLKVRIDNQDGSVWNQWFKFYDSAADANCMPASNALAEESNYFPTVYNLPAGGARVGVIGTCEEDADAHIIIKGTDLTGREIYTEHKCEQVSGEYLSIKKGQLRVTTTVFGSITNVVKTHTKGYVQLYGVDLERNLRYFLSDYSPFEEIPQYRRFRLTTRCRENAIVTVIGRIRLKERYADSDVLPIENINLLRSAAQVIQLGVNNDLQLAAGMEGVVDKRLSEENLYKAVTPGQPMDVFYPTSPGTIRGIVSGFPFRRFWTGFR